VSSSHPCYFASWYTITHSLPSSLCDYFDILDLLGHPHHILYTIFPQTFSWTRSYPPDAYSNSSSTPPTSNMALQADKTSPLKELDLLNSSTQRQIRIETYTITANVKIQRIVRFNPSVVVVPREVDTQEDLEQSWYRDSDYPSFTVECCETISAFHRDLLSLDTNKYCLLGLEQDLTEQMAMKCKRRAMECRQAVLTLQLHQHVSGISDPERLKEASLARSRKGSKHAFLRATVKHALTA
jgi:hypothetical protein